MSIINYPSPDSFQSLISNLKAVLIEPQSDLGAGLEVVPKQNNEPLCKFDEILKKTEELFWNFHTQTDLRSKENEYTPGRVSVRLERIAQTRYGMSLDEAHQMMKPFTERVLSFLKSNLPKSTRFLNSDLPQEQNGTAFYQEPQRKVLSCQAHAFNAYIGEHVVDLDSNILSSIDADIDGIDLKYINAIAKKNAVTIPLTAFNEQNCEAFIACNSVHAFCYRKDPDGNWWKIDSLYKISEWVYQTPVDLQKEKAEWGKTLTVLNSSVELKKLFVQELSELSEALKNTLKQVIENEENVDLQSLRGNITNCLELVSGSNFAKLSEFYIEESKEYEGLTDLQGYTRETNPLIQKIAAVNLDIRRNQFTVDKCKKSLQDAQEMIERALSTLKI